MFFLRKELKMKKFFKRIWEWVEGKRRWKYYVWKPNGRLKRISAKKKQLMWAFFKARSKGLVSNIVTEKEMRHIRGGSFDSTQLPGVRKIICKGDYFEREIRANRSYFYGLVSKITF